MDKYKLNDQIKAIHKELFYIANELTIYEIEIDKINKIIEFALELNRLRYDLLTGRIKQKNPEMF